MNAGLIDRIMQAGEFPHAFTDRELVETHISYVILGSGYAYKFKKDMVYSFLDFSTLEKRKYYCEREVMLNDRLSEGIYLGVVAVRLGESGVFVDTGEGDVVDYAVKMRRLDGNLQMHAMLDKGQVTEAHIRTIARVLRAFHDRTEVIRNPVDMDRTAAQFNDLLSVEVFIRGALGAGHGDRMVDACRMSDRFLAQHRDLVVVRMNDGFVRDGHGDLHSRNIFLYPEPVIFDCLEFNDAFRQVDILDEIAFFCMDLEAAGADDLSKSFLHAYFDRPGDRFGQEERLLFTYYKSYRANVRAKVNTLRAMSGNEAASRRGLQEFERYLVLMERYLAAFA